MNRLKRLLRGPAEAGFTIIELMVAIILLAVVSTSFLAATNSIYKGIHKQQGVADAADGNRKVLSILDKQVRYASAVNTPGIVSGNFFAEYLWTKASTTTIDTPTCTQWELNPSSDVLKYRNWPALTTLNPANNQPWSSTNTPTWITTDVGVTNDPTVNPPFTLLPPSSPPPLNLTYQYQRLQVNLIAKRDTGNVTTTSTYTALNTPSSAALTTATCQEVLRTWQP